MPVELTAAWPCVPIIEIRRSVGIVLLVAHALLLICLNISNQKSSRWILKIERYTVAGEILHWLGSWQAKNPPIIPLFSLIGAGTAVAAEDKVEE